MRGIIIIYFFIFLFYMMLTNILLILLILSVLFFYKMENYESSASYNMFSPKNMNTYTEPIKLSNPLSASDIFYNESKNCPNTSPIFY